jgi:penicillin-binding protein 1A
MAESRKSTGKRNSDSPKKKVGKAGSGAPPSDPPGKRAGAAGKRAGAPDKKSGARKKAAGGRRRIWSLALAFGLFGIALGSFALMAVLSYYGRDLPTIETLKDYRPPQITRVVDRKGRLIAALFEQRRTVVPMKDIPRVLVLSVLAAEDADFYRHKGLDYAGIMRAILRDALSGKAVQGASTITQQIVKNLLLTPERTLARKVRELILARQLEQKLSKDEILFLYLNHIYFGHGRYGVQEASRFYFGKDVQELSLAEASLIAGIPQAPSRLSPLAHPQAAQARQHYVLDQLEQKRAQYWPDLTAAEIVKARAEQPALEGRQAEDGEAPELASLARELLEKQVGKEAARRGGYRIETGLDLAVQAQARKALREGLGALDARHGLLGPYRSGGKRPAAKAKTLVVGKHYDALVTGHAGARVLVLDVAGHRAEANLQDAGRHNPKALPAASFAPKGAVLRVSVLELAHDESPAQVKLELGAQGAVVVIDPRSRDVLALVGADQAVYGFNRALSARRQPGSAFKPISYALALQSRRFTPASLVIDAPEVFDQWKPNNYETWTYSGAVRLRDALARSINLVAIRVTQDLTPTRVAQFAKQLGIDSPLEPTLALALGASGVTPLELVNAYATFAAGGRYAAPHLVKRIVGPDGKRVALPEPPAPRNVLTPAEAFLITSLLTSVVKDGTAKAALELKRPAAGKTGTSNDARDAWFVGYTPELVAGVWVGYDDLRSLGKGESGSKAALPIWIALLKQALAGKAVVDFPVPGGLVRLPIDRETGKLAYEGMPNPIDEYFLEGTQPTETATPPDVLDSDEFLMNQFQ